MSLCFFSIIYTFSRALDSCFSQGKKRKSKRKEGTKRKKGGKKEMNEKIVKKIKEKRKTRRWKEKLGKPEKKKTEQVIKRGKWEREGRKTQSEPDCESKSTGSPSFPQSQAALKGTSPAAFKHWGCCPVTDHHPKKWNVGFTSENFHLLFHQVKWNTEFKVQANGLCFLWDTWAISTQGKFWCTV